ncbi:hypothetical protein [Polaromonas sp.]|uniref:hypothetical protein n=1 Tax=Polaromonas sp. TaxID=1869339 RepID=UPI003BB52194
MSRLARIPVVHLLRQVAFSSLHWPGWTFEAAMQDPTRARIIHLIATHCPPKMDRHNIIPISRIEREAQQAAERYDGINAACPYPFDSHAGRLFKEFFLLACENMKKTASCARSTGASSY